MDWGDRESLHFVFLAEKEKPSRAFVIFCENGIRLKKLPCILKNPREKAHSKSRLQMIPIFELDKREAAGERSAVGTGLRTLKGFFFSPSLWNFLLPSYVKCISSSKQMVIALILIFFRALTTIWNPYICASAYLIPVCVHNM